MRTITEQIIHNINDYEILTVKMARSIQISDSAFDRLLKENEDSESKKIRIIDELTFLNSSENDNPYWVLVEVFPFTTYSLMCVDEDMKYYLEFPTEEETEVEQKQKTVTQQILEFLDDYERYNGQRPNLIRIAPSLLRYIMLENEENPTMFRAERNFYVFNGIEMEPTVLLSNDDFPVSLCYEVKYAVNIPVRNKITEET